MADKDKDQNDNPKNVVDEQPETTEDGTRVVRTVGRDFRVEGNVVDGYIGVDAEYRTYANETEKPLLSDEDVDFLEKTDTPTDVELLTMRYSEPPKSEDAELTDEAPSKVLSEKKADESVGETKQRQGQGQKPGDPVSAETRQSSASRSTGTSTSQNDNKK